MLTFVFLILPCLVSDMGDIYCIDSSGLLEFVNLLFEYSTIHMMTFAIALFPPHSEII